MDTMLILGDGALGRAVEAEALARDAADTRMTSADRETDRAAGRRSA